MVLPLIAGIIIILVGLVAFNFRAIMIDVVGHFIQLRLDDHEGWLYYGELLDGAGYHLEALDALKRSVTISPNYSAAWEKLGRLYGKRTFSRTAVISGEAIAYPTRKAASRNALENVRKTTQLGFSNNSPTTDV